MPPTLESFVRDTVLLVCASRTICVRDYAMQCTYALPIHSRTRVYEVRMTMYEGV